MKAIILAMLVVNVIAASVAIYFAFKSHGHAKRAAAMRRFRR